MITSIQLEDATFCLLILQTRVIKKNDHTDKKPNWHSYADCWFAEMFNLFRYYHDIILLIIWAILVLTQQGSYIDVANILGYKEFVKLVEVSRG